MFLQSEKYGKFVFSNNARKSKTKNGRIASLASNPWIIVAISGRLNRVTETG